jgi:hypothetical protein
MWFDYRKGVASLYKYETDRRLFAMASGRCTRRERRSKPVDEEAHSRWPAERWKGRWARWMGQSG